MDNAPILAYYRAVLPYYDASLHDRGDLPFWSSMARRWESRGILELGCGAGRVTAALAASAPVTAVDLSLEMLERASRSAPAARLVAADLRRFALRSTFDLVILADDPMAHLTSSNDRTIVMRMIANHLAPGGRLVLEGLYRPLRERLWVPAREVFRDGRKLFTVEERWEPSTEPSIWRATYRYHEGSSTLEAAAMLRSWTPDELDRLRDAGLLLETVWGDFDESPFRTSSARMIIVAKIIPSLP
jgi:SAM-dependent methyltransferase